MVLRCNKLNQGSTEMFEFPVRNSELFGTNVPTCQACVHQKFIKLSDTGLEISLNFLISLRMYANYQTDRHTKNSKLLGTSVTTFQECLRKIPERNLIQNWRYTHCQILVRK